jgi:nitrogen fixation NifU-like protein
MSYETESCIFCQASASLLSKVIKKSNVEKLRHDINEINISHKSKKIILRRKYKPFRKLFQQKYKERFSCILLPFNALLKIVNNDI